jgi:hypothetical protein
MLRRAANYHPSFFAGVCFQLLMPLTRTLLKSLASLLWRTCGGRLCRSRGGACGASSNRSLSITGSERGGGRRVRLSTCWCFWFCAQSRHVCVERSLRLNQECLEPGGRGLPSFRHFVPNVSHRSWFERLSWAQSLWTKRLIIKDIVEVFRTVPINAVRLLARRWIST